MEPAKAWIKEQWNEKKFRLLMIFTVAAVIVLCAEFCRFQYSILKAIRYLILVAGLSMIAWIDGKSKRIPNELLMVLFAARTAILIVECMIYREMRLTLVITFVSGLMIGGGIFLFCYLITRGAVGAGDVKLFAVVGYYLGCRVIFTEVFMTIIFAAGYGIIQLIFHKTGLKEEMPFAPFVFLGTLAAVVLGI